MHSKNKSKNPVTLGEGKKMESFTKANEKQNQSSSSFKEKRGMEG